MKLLCLFISDNYRKEELDWLSINCQIVHNGQENFSEIICFSRMTTSICTVPIRVSKNNREIDPTEDERQGIVQNITKQAYWHVSSCKPGKIFR